MLNVGDLTAAGWCDAATGEVEVELAVWMADKCAADSEGGSISSPESTIN